MACAWYEPEDVVSEAGGAERKILTALFRA